MSTSAIDTRRCWSVTELRRMTAQERDAILASAAEEAAEDYQHDAALTAFEAFGKGDLYVNSSDTQSR